MSFSIILNKLCNKKDLDSSESKELMSSIMDKKLTDAQIGAALIALKNKGVSADELSAFVKIIREFAVKIKPNVKQLVDTCGTGGDKSNTFNISTVSAFVLAGCGVFVAKHGNKAVSSSCGSADVLQALGVNINIAPKDIEKCIEQIGIGFLFAQKHHPAFKNVGHIRKELGTRTVFNMLGPLLNPANVEAQVIGVFNPKLTELYAETLKKIGVKSAMVVHGDGLDEITLCGKTKITQLKDGKIDTFYLEPEEFGFKQCSIDELKADDIEESEKIFLDVLKREKSPKRDIVLLNAAAGLIVAGKAKDFKEGVEMAAQSIDSGNALKKLEELREVSNDLAKNN